MSKPELPDPITVVSGLPADVPLKLASLAAGIPILFLRQELGSEALIVFLTLLFYLGPYVLIGFAPPPEAAIPGRICRWLCLRHVSCSSNLFRCPKSWVTNFSGNCQFVRIRLAPQLRTSYHCSHHVDMAAKK